jgi:hypothetical protein
MGTVNQTSEMGSTIDGSGKRACHSNSLPWSKKHDPRRDRPANPNDPFWVMLQQEEQ